MMRIEAVIRPTKMDDVRHALNEAGVGGMSITDIRGCGRQRGFTERYRGSEYTINLLHKVKVDIVANDDDVQRIIGVICDAARTGEVGDGKIFVSPVAEVIRIRTGDHGPEAL